MTIDFSGSIEYIEIKNHTINTQKEDESHKEENLFIEIIQENKKTEETKELNKLNIEELDTDIKEGDTEQILDLVETAENLNSIQEVISNIIENSSEVTESFVSLISLAEGLQGHEHSFEWASEMALGMRAASDLGSLGSAIFKYLIIKEAEKWVENNRNKEGVNPENIKSMENLIAKQRDELKEKTLVASVRAGCTSFRVAASILSHIKEAATSITVLGWLVSFVEITLQAYSLGETKSSLKMIEDYMKELKPITIDRENRTKFNKFVESCRILYNNNKLPLETLIEDLQDQGLYTNEIREAVRKTQYDGFMANIKSPEIFLENLENLLRSNRASEFNKFKMETLVNVVQTLKKKVQNNKEFSERDLINMREDLEMVLTIKEQRVLLQLNAKTLLDALSSKDMFTKINASVQENNPQVFEKIDPTSKVINDLINKRKEAFNEKLKTSETQFNKFLESWKDWSIKDIDNWLKNKEVNIPEVTNLLPSFTLSQSPENMIDKLDIIEIRGDSNKKILEILSKPENKKIVHEAYVKSQEATSSMIKQTLKSWAIKSTSFHQAWLQFTSKKEHVAFAVAVLTTVATITLTILTLSGTIACPPLVIAAIGAAATMTSISLTLLGLYHMYAEKPNLFKTYLNGQQLGLKLAETHASLVQLGYSTTINLIALAKLFPSKMQLINLEGKKEAWVEAKEKRMKVLEGRVAIKQQAINEIAWKDTAKLQRLGTKKLASADVIKQLKEFILLDKSRIFDLLKDAEFVALLKDHMGIDMASLMDPSKESSSDETEIEAILVDALLKKIEDFMIQDTSSQITQVNVHTSKSK